MMLKALIFGINGQDGYYLRELLQSNDIEVMGISRSNPGQQKISWVQGDVGDGDFVEELIRKEKPAYIFHLAANSAVRHELLFEHQSTIVKGSLNILESAYRHSPQTKAFITGSGLQFVNNDKPISEKDPFIANNAYSLARIQAVYAARYFRSKGIRTYVGYLFHHDSPLRTAQHLNRKIIETVKKAAAGEAIKLPIGDISVEKEYGFAGDIAEGMFRLVQQDDLFEACIGTGKAYSIQHWLEICFNTVGKKWQDYIEQKNDFTPDFKRLVSDSSAMKKINWQAKTGIEELAKMMLAD